MFRRRDSETLSYDINYQKMHNLCYHDFTVDYSKQSDFENDQFVLSRNLIFDLTHLKVVLECLSKLHLTNIKNKIQHNINGNREVPDELNDRNNEESLLDIEELRINLWHDTKQKQLLSLIDELHEFSSTKEFFKNQLNELMENEIKTKNDGVICNENLKLDNILFKYENGTPVECKLKTFRSVACTPSVCNVLTLIYSTTERIWRSKHLYELLEYYYNCLKTQCKTQKIILNELLPLDQFEKEIYNYLPKVKLISAFLKIQNIESIHSSLVSNSADNHINNLIKLNVEYKNQILDSLSDLQEYILYKPLRLTVEDMYEIMKKKLGTTQFKIENFNSVSIGKSKGFLGDHNKLLVHIRTDENNEIKVVNLFVKLYPEKCAFVDVLVDSNVFFKEIFTYTTCVKGMKKHGINVIDDCFAPCYFTRPDHCLVFEDLVTHGFIIPDQRKYFTPQEIKTVLQTLAKFHAAGILYEEKLSEKCETKVCLKDKYPVGLCEAFYSNNNEKPFIKYLLCGRNVLLHLIDKFYPSGDNEGFKNFCLSLVQKSVAKVTPSTKFRNTICHGDLWPTNFFIKYVDDNPVDCRLIDMQIVRYCPPAHDVIFVIFYCTNKATREKHLKDFLTHYYSVMKNTLEIYGHDPESIYSFEELIETCDDVLLQAVFQSSVWYQLSQLSAEAIEEINSVKTNMSDILYNDRRSFCESICDRDPNYRRRMEEVIQTLKNIYEEGENRIISEMVYSK
ncbi:uncharacterized protein LOC108742455 isoform X2 [Agrilus planipennis]|uniref:Uncharacterized protein LOC108742455 isoform X2 n=1 Tax=Agrilus planipennis TaxID=224129 RepID=A0A1W4XLB0_AGRPL|nr:uncharacterized protein LOC108742455 isoform X2 [Agrilus planipennis]